MAGGAVTVVVGAEDESRRLDRWFKRHHPEIGRDRLEKLLRTGQIRVDGKRVRAGTRLAVGNRVRVPPHAAGATPSPGTSGAAPAPRPAEAEALRAAVLYRDVDLIALNKPAGLAVQGGSRVSHHLDAMLEALRFEADERPRLVHRLDRDTSGVLLLARNSRAARELTGLFRRGEIRKLYWALCVGVPRPVRGRIDLPLAKRRVGARERVVGGTAGGARAVTDYVVVEAAGRRLSWLAFMPRTGRTHQLRVHAASALGRPIVGDGKYGGRDAFVAGFERRLHLHARALVLPGRDGASLPLVAPLPPHMAAGWRLLGFETEPRDDPFLPFDSPARMR